MRMRPETILAVFGLLTIATAAIADERPVDERPNILFIMVDDLGKEWVSCYGSDAIETPNVDRLAAEGLRFTNAYSMPQCTPTRVTLLTGQYPWRHGWCNHWDVPRWGGGCHFDWKHNVAFARVLQEAGYATAAAGKWQINDFRVHPDAMQRHGFDEYCMWTGFETGNPPSAERYWNPYIHASEGSRPHEGRFGEDVFTDFLIDFMRRNKDRPMMMYYPMALTHGPLTTTPDEPDAEGKVARHEAMVRYTDKVLGRLLDALEEMDLRKRTIVIWTTDNGTGGSITGSIEGRPVKGGKAKLSENGVCEPFIVSCPGLVPEGAVTDALTDFSDLPPTFAELAGTSMPEDVILDGKSLAPLLVGKADDGPRAWIMAMGHGPATLTEEGVRPKQDFTDRVVRDKRFKLWVLDGEPAKLFDLANDPWEETNLIDSDDPEVAAARERLTAVVDSCFEKDAWPKYTPQPPQPWEKKIGVKKAER